MDHLKEEAENGFVEISKLHTSIFTDQINQLFSNINITIDNLGNQIKNDIKLQKNIKNILDNNSYIRSINILDENHKIIYSSNNKNLNKSIDISQYYPTPMFNNNILRFGKAQNGRDLFEKDTVLSYLPVFKKISNSSQNYSVHMTINSDFITNRYFEYLKNNSEGLDIIRIDNILLYSSVDQKNLGNTIDTTQLYKKSIEKSLSSGIEFNNGKKYIVAYQLTDIYPLVVSVKLDYYENLKEWEYKTQLTLLLIGFIVLGIALVVIKLLLKYQKAKNKEIEYQKQQIINQEKLRNAYIVYNNTNDGILITDENCNIIDVNKAFFQNTGYNFNEVYGNNPKILNSNIHDKSFYINMWEQIETENYWHGEIVNKNKNGELYTELLTINRVLDKNNNIKNYIGIFTNITKQKEQEKLLEEKEQFIFHQSKMAAMGEMLENIAHQWRQPLSTISTAATASLVEKEVGISTEETDIERYILINDSAQHLSKTIDDFRSFFKPDKEKKDFYLNNVIEKSLKILGSKFKNRNIHLIKNIDNLKMNGYENELVQVVMNILNNARDALENKEDNQRFIFVDISSQNENVIIKIKDSGGGIPKDIINKVFEPYFTTKHQSQGTGIGLYMSEEIVTKHLNGLITVKNVDYNYENNKLSGAEFTLTFKMVE